MSPDKKMRILNWTTEEWTHTFFLSKSYLTPKGDTRMGNEKVTLTLAPGEEAIYPEGTVHYLAARLAEWSYGKTGANIAIAQDRDERILKAMPDLVPTTAFASENMGEEIVEEAEEVEEAPKKKASKKKVEEDFAGLKEEEKA